jgi:PTH1 family peptidyl-tRNA hydrolase
MKYLIVGLGNPGSKYTETRHNIGFKVVEAFSKEREGNFALNKQAEVAEVKFKGRTIILIKPTTF